MLRENFRHAPHLIRHQDSNAQREGITPLHRYDFSEIFDACLNVSSRERCSLPQSRHADERFLNGNSGLPERE